MRYRVAIALAISVLGSLFSFLIGYVFTFLPLALLVALYVLRPRGPGGVGTHLSLNDRSWPTRIHVMTFVFLTSLWIGALLANGMSMIGARSIGLARTLVLTPASHGLLRQYSRRFPEGYRLKNQVIRYSLEERSPGKTTIIYDVTYRIVGHKRVAETGDPPQPTCPKFVLTGDSHNFGQALTFEQSLQGQLARTSATLNLAVPGYGLNNAIANLLDGDNFEDEVAKCRGSFSGTTFVYRMIDDHVNRNVGKTSFNAGGPDFFPLPAALRSPNDRIYQAFCANLTSCIAYLATYATAAVPAYMAYRSAEPMTQDLGRILYRLSTLTSQDYARTLFLIELFGKTVHRKFPGADYLVVIEDADHNFFSGANIPFQTLLPILEDERSKKMRSKGHLITQSEVIAVRKSLPSECEGLDSLYIKNEGHPNPCSNALLRDYLLTRVRGSPPDAAEGK